jgi:hypothetical protein
MSRAAYTGPLLLTDPYQIVSASQAALNDEYIAIAPAYGIAVKDATGNAQVSY